MSTQPVFTFTNTDQSPRTFVANGLRGPAGPNTINSSTALAYSGLTMANGDWNLVVANAAGSGFNRLDMSATARSLLEVSSGDDLRSVLGSGTHDATTYLRGDGTWATIPDGTLSNTTPLGTLSADSSSAFVLTGNSGGTFLRKVTLGATGRSLLGVADGAALRAALGTGTADNTTLLDGSGAWVLKSSITTTDASLLTSGTLADARLSANVALRNAANIFTVGGQQINSASASSVPLTIKGTTSQSGNLTQWQDVNGVTFARVNSSRQFSNNGGVPNSEAFGNGAVVSSTGGTAIGSGATAAGSAVAVGRLANGNTQSAVALGAGAIANAVGALAMGQNASATGVGAISIGNNSQAAGAGGAMIGAGQDSRANTLCYFGSGTPPTFSLIGTTPALGQGRPIVDFVSAWADSTDATRQGRLSLGTYGIVSGVETLQEAFRIDANSSGVPRAIAIGSLVANVTPPSTDHYGDYPALFVDTTNNGGRSRLRVWGEPGGSDQLRISAGDRGDSSANIVYLSKTAISLVGFNVTLDLLSSSNGGGTPNFLLLRGTGGNDGVKIQTAGANTRVTFDKDGNITVANSVSVPSVDPTGGGILYVESGALKYRGSGGTVTTIAAA